MRTVPIVLVGGGIAGLATAWWLAQLGAREVVLLERSPALGRSATGHSAAILRSASDELLLEEFALASARFLCDPPGGFAPRPLVERVGVVLLGRGRESPPQGWERRVAHQRHARALQPAEFARLAPWFRAHGEDAWYFPGEGRVDVERTVASFARGAAERGVELRTGAGVLRLERDGARHVLELSDGTLLATERLVLAAGGWSARLGRAAGSRIELQPTRRHLFLLAPRAGVDARGPIVWNERLGFYARPERGGLLACACDTAPGAPEQHAVDERALRAFRAAAGEHLGLDTTPDDGWSGTRTFASDERFVIGPDPDVAGLHWVAGLGGHGITAGAAAGELAARQLLGLPHEARFARAFAPRRLLGALVPTR